jgi:hypothetical protein
VGRWIVWVIVHALGIDLILTSRGGAMDQSIYVTRSASSETINLVLSNIQNWGCNSIDLAYICIGGVEVARSLEFRVAVAELTGDFDRIWVL